MKTKIVLAAFTVILITALVPDVRAQYNMQAGVRVGGTTGVTAKYFYQPSYAIEGIIGTFGNGFSITGLWEKYRPIYDRYNNAVEGLYLYYGGGPHLAFYNGDSNNDGLPGREVNYHRNNDVGFGFNGIVGLEYRMPRNIPIAFTADLKPFVEIGSAGHVSAAPDPSVGVKFIFRE
jgi:hypothetical protein